MYTVHCTVQVDMYIVYYRTGRYSDVDPDPDPDPDLVGSGSRGIKSLIK